MMKVIFYFLFIYFSMNYSLVTVFYVNMCFLFMLPWFICFFFNVSYGWVGVGAGMGWDMISYVMIMLTIWILGLMGMALLSDKPSIWKLVMFNFVLVVLLMFFSVYSLLLMYFFFEISLIPTFYIILMWGDNLERVESGMYLMMYMMFISFPLLAYMMKMYYVNMSLDMNVSIDSELNFMVMELGFWDFMIIFMAFFIKLPIYLFHTWLPKAHVEAPVYGSMLLAALLLKLGGYGLLRLVVVFTLSCKIYSTLFISVSVVGALFVSLLCMVQVDMKSLVAYSSVVHMNFMVASIFTNMKMGIISSVVVMVSHGLCSSGLFFMVMVFYKRSFSRLLILNMGNINIVPCLMIWWFMLCMSNFSFPFSMNFLGEIILIMAVISWSFLMVLFVSLIGIFTGAYSLYLFSVVMHGSMSSYLRSGNGSSVSESLLAIFHVFPLLGFMLNMSMYF